MKDKSIEELLKDFRAINERGFFEKDKSDIAKAEILSKLNRLDELEKEEEKQRLKKEYYHEEHAKELNARVAAETALKSSEENLRKAREENTYDIGYLKRLQAATNEAIDNARDEDIKGAINWGDLSCLNAEQIFNQNGEVLFRVTIEEAAPDNMNFQEFIAGQLFNAGYQNVEVVTEW